MSIPASRGEGLGVIGHTYQAAGLHIQRASKDQRFRLVREAGKAGGCEALHHRCG